MKMKSIIVAIGILLGVGLAPTPSVLGPPVPPRVTLPPTLFAAYRAPEPANGVSAPSRCGRWRDLALSVGWSQDQWPTLDYIIWRESRCLPEVVNTTLNGDGSHDYGLTQINDKSWCQPNRWWPDGWLQAQRIVRNCDQLRWPIYNLAAAYAIWNYSYEQNGNGWQPWGI